MIIMADEQQVQVESKEIMGAAPDAQPSEKKSPRKRAPRKQPSGEGPASPSSAPSGKILLFGKYSYDVEIRDPSLKNYVNLRPLVYPNTFRHGSQKKFSKAAINIVERLANDMMRGGTGSKIGGHVIRTKGRLQGKKITVMKIIENAFARVHSQTNQNPLQVLVYALENSAPIEDTTRVRYGGIISNVPVDISASRRLDIAIRNLSMATITASFGGKKTMTDALVGELVLAARNDVNSYAIKRKNEIERMARSAK
jgi:small subunit ribosomal protein S7